jgi:hypothetical protein
MLDAEPQQISTIAWLLQSGGLIALVWGLIIATIGIIPLIRPSITASVLLGVLSLLPAIFGAGAVYFAAAEYVDMAASATPPKPAEFSAITGRAMSYSFCALLGTLLAVSVTALSMWRSRKCENRGRSLG